MRINGLVALVAVVSSVASPALTCSQPNDWTIEKEFAESGLVFRGLVTATELNPLEFDADGSKVRMLVDIRYEVTEVFKGKPKTNGTISTTTAIMGGCGVPVLVGQDFLFYVKPFGNEVRSQFPLLATQSQGVVSIDGSQMLPSYPPRLEEALAEVRALANQK